MSKDGIQQDAFYIPETEESLFVTEPEVKTIINGYFPNTIMNLNEITTIPDTSKYILSVQSTSTTPKVPANKILVSNFKDVILGHPSGDVTGSGSTIIGGTGNSVTGDYSGIFVGSYNSVTGDNSVIAGGKSNSVTGTYSMIAGGQSNNVSTNFSVIAGGALNSVTRTNSMIAGGQNNNVSGDYSVIAGGNINNVSGDNSVIAGGQLNNVSGDLSFISGGQYNKVSGTHSAIAGGRYNNVTGDYSGIFCGESNSIKKPSAPISTEFSVIAGGYNNVISFDNSMIAGGHNNTINSSNGGILGGEYNELNNQINSCIIGGSNNNIFKDESVIIGGDFNISSSEFSVIAGGQRVTLTGTNYNYCLAIGKDNDISGSNSIIESPHSGVDGVTASIGTNMRFIIGDGTATTKKNVFQVDNNGNVFLGGTGGATGTSLYNWNGSQYEAKAFTIQHPEKEEKWLVHGCLEGPEAGVYYRGKDIAPVAVSLPSYATKIAKNFSVNVTPIGDPRNLSVSEVSEEGLFNVNGEGKFFWHAFGERIKLNTEPDKDSVKVNRLGPYTWLGQN